MHRHITDQTSKADYLPQFSAQSTSKLSAAIIDTFHAPVSLRAGAPTDKLIPRRPKRTRPVRRLTGLLAALALLHPLAASAVALDEQIRQQVETFTPTAPSWTGGVRLGNATSLRRFYEERNFRPLWLADSATAAATPPSKKRIMPGRAPETLADALTSAISEVGSEGLLPADYHFVELQQLERANDSDARVTRELVLSDAFLRLANHLLRGKVDPKKIVADWRANPRQRDVIEMLEKVESVASLEAILDELRPHQPRYSRLRTMMGTLRYLPSQDWEELAVQPAIKPAANDERIPEIKRRLVIWGDWDATEGSVADAAGLPVTDNAPTPGGSLENQARTEDGNAAGASDVEMDPNTNSPSVDPAHDYDSRLQRAVQRFQKRHGLEPDGVMGRKTLEALNVSPAERIPQIAANLERWRWLSDDFGDRFVVVNIAGYDLRVYEKNVMTFQTPVIVGRYYRKTPVFSDRIRYLVLNPTWTVPQKLAVQDKLPEAQADPTYFSRLGMTLFEHKTGLEVDPLQVDWQAVPTRGFPYRIVQAPGPMNALGQVKFMFPNDYNVYLHDTPTRDLFAKNERAFSSGCIRVSRPLEFAELILKDSGWDRSRIDAALETEKTVTVNLETPVPVHLEYWTAWIAKDGVLQFREDIYKRDPDLITALAQPLDAIE